MEKREILDYFFTYLTYIKCYSPRTVENYFRVASSFINGSNKELNEINIEDVINFFEVNTQNTNNTKNNKLSALICFGKYLLEFGYWNSNIFEFIEHPEYEVKFATYLELPEIEKFLDVINKKSVIGLRDLCIFEFLYSSGVRVSELCNLKVSDLHIDDAFAIVTGKGNKQRIVIFGELCKLRLKKYFELSRPLLFPGFSEYVFVSQKGRQISRKTIWSRYKLYCEKAGIKQSNVHSLRHSFATHLLENGADLLTVSKLLGHKDLSTTTMYTHITDKQLEDTHKKHFKK